jgi:hypothetical protein
MEVDMKAVIAISLLVALLGVSSAAGVASEARGPVVVGCTSQDLDRFTVEEAPSRCILLTKPYHGAVGTSRLSSMQWKHWGHARVRGNGEFGSGSTKTPAKVTLSKPVTVCGVRVYTKFRLRTPEVPGLGEGASGPLVHSCRLDAPQSGSP